MSEAAGYPVSNVGLRIDVCNRRAFQEGVPVLLDLLDRARIEASFFVTLGPDRAGRSLLRLTEPGFVSKMIRTRAWRMYGLRTLLSGTLLPARPVGHGLPESLRHVEAEGHEIALHGWDHASWLRRIDRMTAHQIACAWVRARDAFVDVLGHAPRASGAPGWRCTALSLALQDGEGLAYASDCRGDRPFRPRIAGRTLRTLQVPTTLPTSDELLGAVPADHLATFYLDRILAAPREPHVLTVHAESEGGVHFRWFESFITRAVDAGVRIEPLGAVAGRWVRAAPALGVARRRIAGRSGHVMHAIEPAE